MRNLIQKLLFLSLLLVGWLPLPPAAAAPLLASNPSTGHVRVGYGLPQAAKAVTLRVYDQWGAPMSTYALTDETLAEGVTLKLRAGIYHCTLEADGAIVAKERLLLITAN